MKLVGQEEAERQPGGETEAGAGQGAEVRLKVGERGIVGAGQGRLSSPRIHPILHKPMVAARPSLRHTHRFNTSAPRAFSPLHPVQGRAQPAGRVAALHPPPLPQPWSRLPPQRGRRGRRELLQPAPSR